MIKRKVRYAYMAKDGPTRRTWSMDHPVYAYTDACSDARYQPGGCTNKPFCCTNICLTGMEGMHNGSDDLLEIKTDSQK